MREDGAIAICATFTAEPLADSLKYWLTYLRIDAAVEFAPYNQVVQTLVNPQGVFARNKSGLNVVLLRFEDWEKNLPDAGIELVAALKTASSLCDSPVLVCICPPSPMVQSDLFDKLEQELIVDVSSLPGIRVLPSARLIELYPASSQYDSASDRLGHIPYTPEAYAALGTAIARMFHSFRRPPFKVIAVDCDNTLWRGVCGEAGPHGIALDASSLAVQTFLKARLAEGMLLCVCSKNSPEDVEAVFDAHPEMPLQRSDFIGWQVNWRPKSQNIHLLAAKLSLGLDAIIFLDDNPMETAEVQAHCPGTLALTLPSDLANIPGFLNHVWAFDQSSITFEDKQRTRMYREDELRRRDRVEALSYADFMRALDLKVILRELTGAAELERAAQMTQRTNQFNLTTQRFTAPEIKHAIDRGAMQILTAFVSDRYGDYGQVGLVMYEVTNNVLRVRNLLLSCRVLGKGVEHAIVARLGRIAETRHLAAIELPYEPTPKNQPAREFLMSLGEEYRSAAGQGFVCLPASAAAAVTFAVPASPGAELARTIIPPANIPGIDFMWIAEQRNDAASVLQAINDDKAIHAAPRAAQPRNETERQVTRIWERALRISPIGVHDNFFDLGGESLLAVRILADLRSIIDCDLPLSTRVTSPTIAQLANLLRAGASHLVPRAAGNCLVPLKSSGTRPPFYCVHGVGGSAIEFMDLARRVHVDQPFYGVQAVQLADAALGRMLTVEEMAARYITEIRELQQEGPYYLGGSSFGGLVAYEMARQLTAAGQAVGIVALFDTSVPGRLNLQGIANPMKRRLDTFNYALSLHWHNLRVQSSGERMAYIRKKVRRLLAQVRHRPDAIRLSSESGQWAARSYVPGSYSGSITLFRATRQPPWILPSRTLGWESLAAGGVQVYDTPGHHADLVRDPRARVLAAQLDDALAKAQDCVAVAVDPFARD
jgi:FkbH-like protein